MTRTVLVYRKDLGVIVKGGALDVRHAEPSNRSHLAAPMIIRDTMDAVRHPVTGLYSDSKSSFERMTKDAGCVCVGNEAPRTPSAPELPDVGSDVVEAYCKVRDGYKPSIPVETLKEAPINGAAWVAND